MLTVADVMTTEVFTIRSSATVAQAMVMMQDNQVRSLLVEPEVQGGDHGIVTERDIVYQVTAEFADPTEVIVCEIMRKPCIWVEPSLTLPEVSQRFESSGIQRAPVMRQGQLLGIVSITDIIMKSNLTSVSVPDDFSRRIETALRHKRLSWNKDSQIQQECETAWDVLEELQAQNVSTQVD